MPTLSPMRGCVQTPGNFRDDNPPGGIAGNFSRACAIFSGYMLKTVTVSGSELIVTHPFIAAVANMQSHKVGFFHGLKMQCQQHIYRGFSSAFFAKSIARGGGIVFGQRLMGSQPSYSDISYAAIATGVSETVTTNYSVNKSRLQVITRSIKLNRSALMKANVSSLIPHLVKNTVNYAFTFHVIDAFSHDFTARYGLQASTGKAAVAGCAAALIQPITAWLDTSMTMAMQLSYQKNELVRLSSVRAELARLSMARYYQIMLARMGCFGLAYATVFKVMAEFDEMYSAKCNDATPETQESPVLTHRDIRPS